MQAEVCVSVQCVCMCVCVCMYECARGMCVCVCVTIKRVKLSTLSVNNYIYNKDLASFKIF